MSKEKILQDYDGFVASLRSYIEKGEGRGRYNKRCSREI